MQLNHTQAFLQQAAAARGVEYALLAHDGDKEARLLSPTVNEDTYFDIASMGKTLNTTPVVIRAIADGRLSLDDTLEKFFEYVPDDKKDITVLQMLTHTSGIHESTISKMYLDSGIDMIADVIFSHRLDYTPGESFAYSSQNMMLLGFIVEKIYNVPLDGLYYAFVRLPLGLTRSRYNIDPNEKNAVVSYYREFPGANRAADRNVYSMKNCVSGAGGSFSTLHDINLYIQAVLDKNPLLYPEKYFDMAEQNYTLPTAKSARGFGYVIIDRKYPETAETGTVPLFPDGSFGHTGHTGCGFYIDRKHNRYVILLSNNTRCLYKENGFRLTGLPPRPTDFIAEVMTKVGEDFAEQGLI